MIRDPSDGSVKEPKKSAPALDGSLPSGESGLAVTPDCAGADTSGLRRVDATEMAKLEKARNWLKDWHSKKLEGGKCGS